MVSVTEPIAPLRIYDVRKTGQILGAGAFGTVFEVEWNGTTCAAKFMHDIFKEILSAEEKQAFITAFEKECATWSALRHPQIVQFLGIYFDPSHIPVMVLEKMDASLRALLESTTKEDFPLINKVVILRQVAQGLVYLHSHSPKLVHHDLTPNNILVNEVTYLTKLTDFGMTRAIDAASLTRSSSIKGTPGFVAPEALRYPPRYNDKLDVFAYGNVIITVITHQWPTPQLMLERETPVESVSEFQLRQHHLQQFSKEELKAFGGITQLCLENEGSMRPTSTMLFAEMKKIETTVLEGDVAVETEASNIQLAMWRMQKAVQKKEVEITKLNTENQSLQTDISRFSENSRRLEQQLEHLELESQLESSFTSDITSSREQLTETPTGSETDSLLSSSATGTLGRTNPCQCCFQWGRCACCLFTVSICMVCNGAVFRMRYKFYIVIIEYRFVYNVKFSFVLQTMALMSIISIVLALAILSLSSSPAIFPEDYLDVRM